ncbi:MAG: sigma-54-dependent Fis family transcriptional regulator [Alistipes sp.]|nr:sigma-54-dependent Fis family transcriptional regulator [Alistipes sp.]
MTKILLLSPSKGMLNSLRERLNFENITTREADNLSQAIDICNMENIDAAVVDSELLSEEMKIPSIVITNSPSVESAVAALRLGAIDYLSMPIDMNRLLSSLRSISDRGRGVQTCSRRHPSKKCDAQMQPILGISEAIERVRNLIGKVAPSDARVLILGENGTGKELVARWIHLKSNRSAAPFVEVNCAAIPSELIESELFGHEKGSFTSAIKQRKGKFELADGGTLFLDEIGDMSLSAQAKVLRALQENKITRIGGDVDIPVNVRVVAATNKDLRKEIRLGNFREDLYHRLSVIEINVPPLRERQGDIRLLAEHFISEICTHHKMNIKHIDADAIDLLSHYAWTGNIRELHNVVERLIILSDERITAEAVQCYYQA